MTDMQWALQDRFDRLRAWFESLEVWQKVAAVTAGIVLLGMMLSMFALGLGLLLIGVLIVFVLAWFEEVLWLMRQPDSVFPGRFDKLIWALLLFFIPPLGVPALWSYRRSVEAKGSKPFASWRDWS